MQVYLQLVFNCHYLKRSSAAIKLQLITKTVIKCVVLLLPGQLIPIRNFTHRFINAKIRMKNKFLINELSAVYYFVLFNMYFIFIFFFYSKDGDIVRCQYVRIQKAFKISKFFKAWLRSCPSALVPCAQGDESSRILLGKIKAIVKVPEKLLYLAILKTSLHFNLLRLVKVGFSCLHWRTLKTKKVSTRFKYLCS